MGDVLEAVRNHITFAMTAHPRSPGELALSAALIAIAATACGATVVSARRTTAARSPEPSACVSLAGRSGRVRVVGVVEPGSAGPLTEPGSGEPVVWCERGPDGAGQDHDSGAAAARQGRDGRACAAGTRAAPAPAFVIRDLTGTALVAPTTLASADGHAVEVVLRPGERVSLVGRVDHRVGLGPVLVGDPVTVLRLPPDDFGRRRPPRAPVGVRVGLIVTVSAGLAGIFVLGLTFRQ